MRAAPGLLAAVCLAGCIEVEVGDDPSAAATSGSNGATSGSNGATSGSGGMAAASSASNAASASSASSGGAGGDPNDVCLRWKADRANLSEGAWSGSVQSCSAGDVASPARENALRVTNLYRWLAGLPDVALDSASSAAAQQCALMMDANKQLSHNPPGSWKCFSSAGAQIAGKGNLSPTPVVKSIDLYMIDPGNPTTMGHRRWILSNSLGPVGFGSTAAYSCMPVIGGTGKANKPFAAWPPPGKVPIQAWSVSFQTLDQTGWTVQSDKIGLKNAKVKVTDAGEDKPVDTVELLPNYGAASALRFNPKGWKATAGKSYHVAVVGASQPIEYDVVVIDCK
jgi:uncharacterized protein YkwD